MALADGAYQMQPLYKLAMRTLAGHAPGLAGLMAFQYVAFNRSLSEVSLQDGSMMSWCSAFAIAALSCSAVLASASFLLADYLRRIAIDKAMFQGFGLQLPAKSIRHSNIGVCTLVLALVNLALLLVELWQSVLFKGMPLNEVPLEGIQRALPLVLYLVNLAGLVRSPKVRWHECQWLMQNPRSLPTFLLIESFAHEQVQSYYWNQGWIFQTSRAVRQPPHRDDGIELTSRSRTVQEVTPELEPDVSDMTLADLPSLVRKVPALMSHRHGAVPIHLVLGFVLLASLVYLPAALLQIGKAFFTPQIKNFEVHGGNFREEVQDKVTFWIVPDEGQDQVGASWTDSVVSQCLGIVLFSVYGMAPVLQYWNHIEKRIVLLRLTADTSTASSFYLCPGDSCSEPVRRKANMRLNSQQLTMQLTREHFGMRSSFKLCGFFTRIVYVAIVDLQKVQITVGTMSKAAVVSGQPSMFRGKFRSDSIQGETVSFDLTADRCLFDFDLRTSILTTTSNPTRRDLCRASSRQVACKVADFQRWCGQACDLSVELSMKFSTEEKTLRLMVELRNTELFHLQEVSDLQRKMDASEMPEEVLSLRRARNFLLKETYDVYRGQQKRNDMQQKTILLTGLTGAGKSAACRFLTMNESCSYSNSWNSHTKNVSEISGHAFSDEIQPRLRIFDIPGFGDTEGAAVNERQFSQTIRHVATVQESIRLQTVREAVPIVNFVPRMQYASQEELMSKWIEEFRAFLLSEEREFIVDMNPMYLEGNLPVALSAPMVSSLPPYSMPMNLVELLQAVADIGKSSGKKLVVNAACPLRGYGEVDEDRTSYTTRATRDGSLMTVKLQGQFLGKGDSLLAQSASFGCGHAPAQFLVLLSHREAANETAIFEALLPYRVSEWRGVRLCFREAPPEPDSQEDLSRHCQEAGMLQLSEHAWAHSESYEIVQTLHEAQGSINALVFAGHHDFLAAAGDDDTLRVYKHDYSHGGKYVLRATQERDSGITSLAWSPRVQYLAASTVDGKIVVYRLIHHSLEYRASAVATGVAWCGEYVAAANRSGNVELFNVEAGEGGFKLKLFETLRGGAAQVTAVACAGGRIVAASADSHVRLYVHGGLTPIFERTVPGVEAVALWATYLALGSADGSVSLIDFALQSPSYQTTRNDAHEAVLTLALSDERLAAGSANGKVYVYKTEYLLLVSVLSHSVEPIRALAWSSGKTLAAGGNDSTVRLYELAKTVEGHGLTARPRSRDTELPTRLPSSPLAVQSNPVRKEEGEQEQEQEPEPKQDQEQGPPGSMGPKSLQRRNIAKGAGSTFARPLALVHLGLEVTQVLPIHPCGMEIQDPRLSTFTLRAFVMRLLSLVLGKKPSPAEQMPKNRLSTPRSEGPGGRQFGDVDELQIVVGGWNECKREHIEQDVHDIFSRMNGDALVKQIFIPYVRCGYCRIEINYPESDVWKQRKLQGVIVQAIKDRAKVRAVISTWELCVRHVGELCADKDWRGKELGDANHVPLGSSRTDTDSIAGREYQAIVANPLLSHRCSAILVWERGVSSLLGLLSGLPWQTNILIGHDLNQNLHASVDEFVGMMHYREFIFQTSLTPSPPLGNTWIARGSASPIDFFLHQVRGAEMTFHKREDYRMALPSDHNAVGIVVTYRDKTARRTRKRPPRTLCGKWVVSGEALWGELQEQPEWDDAALCRAFRAPGVSSRPPSLRYRDPEEIRDLIKARTLSKDEWHRAALMQEIHQRRIEAKATHKQHLLEEVRNGNCRAIAHIRASASGGKTEGSYIQRCGGAQQASTDLFSFYEKKYQAMEAPPSPEQIQALATRHESLPTPDVTVEEIFRAMKGALSLSLPPGGEVLMTRVHQFAPPYSGHQIGCRPGVQAADGIMAAQTTMQLLKQVRGQAFAAKVDIKAAFDSLSLNAVLKPDAGYSVLSG
ncbi:HET-E1, partial [Symbiodinium sp. KB8]